MNYMEYHITRQPPPTQKKVYTSHTKFLNADNMFECPDCGKCFPKYVSLYKHKRVHTGEKPYGCQTCGRHFAQKVHLTNHIRTHTGEKPFACDVCLKRFAKKSHVTDHMRVHTGERPVACDMCDKTFGSVSTLKNHRRTHTKEKPFKCDLCDRQYRQQTHLKTHIAQYHYGDKPIKCEEPECTAGFYCRFSLKRHMIKDHKKVFPKKEIPPLATIEKHKKSTNVPATVPKIKKEKSEETESINKLKNENQKSLENTSETLKSVPAKIEQQPIILTTMALNRQDQLVLQEKQDTEVVQQVDSHSPQYHTPRPEIQQQHQQQEIQLYNSPANIVRNSPLTMQTSTVSASLIYQLPMEIFRPQQSQIPQNLTMVDHYVNQMPEIVQYSNQSVFPEEVSLNHPQQHYSGNNEMEIQQLQMSHQQQPQSQISPNSHQISTTTTLVQPPLSRQQNRQPRAPTNKPRTKKPKSVECDLCESKFYDRYALKRHMMKEHDETFDKPNPRPIIRPLSKAQQKLLQQQQQIQQEQQQIVQQTHPAQQLNQQSPSTLQPHDIESSQSQQSHHSEVSNAVSYQQTQQLQQNLFQPTALNYSANSFMNVFTGYTQFRNN